MENNLEFPVSYITQLIPNIGNLTAQELIIASKIVLTTGFIRVFYLQIVRQIVIVSPVQVSSRWCPMLPNHFVLWIKESVVCGVFSVAHSLGLFWFQLTKQKSCKTLLTLTNLASITDSDIDNRLFISITNFR